VEHCVEEDTYQAPLSEKAIRLYTDKLELGDKNVRGK
jgi:hypothetical protein